MNAKLPLILTSASVVAMMGASAHAAPTGNPMTYGQSIIITSTSPALNGTGVGTGSGAFDTDGTLSVNSVVATTIFFGQATGFVSASTTYQGSIAGTTWTYSGTATNQITDCTGSGVLCANAVPGPPTTTTGNVIFSVDILAGGTWETQSSLAGLANLDVDHTLAPIPVPAAAWLFGSALLGLAGVSRKRKA